MREDGHMAENEPLVNVANDPERLLAAALDWMPGTVHPLASPGWSPPGLAEVEGILVGCQVVELLGSGGMGAVYKGVQRALHRPVAIKILSPALAADPEFEARFQREAILMARLNHPNIVQIYDFGRSEGGDHYLIMEYVEGTDLQAILRSRSLKWEEVRAIMLQVCAALMHAHEQGCLHRDIKPSNIFLTQKGEVKVGDFGLARVAVEDGSPSGALLDLTMSSVVMGTPGYIAPEQLSPGAAISPRSDIFSLGVVFYEMLTGELPRGNVRPPSRKVRGISRRLDSVVLKAMEAEPEDRYSSAKALSEALSRVPENSAVPFWNGRTGFAAIVAGVCLLGSGFWWSLNEGDSFVEDVSEPAVTAVQSRDEESPAFPNHYQDVGQVYIDEWPEDAHYQKLGPFRAWSSLPQDPALDLSRLRGVDDVVEVHVHTEGWIVRRANGNTVSSDGKADRSGIREICIGLDEWFGLITEEGQLLGFNGDGELPGGDVPHDLGPVKHAYLSPDHRIALLEEGSIRVWGRAHDGVKGTRPEEWAVCPSLPTGRTAVALSGDHRAAAVLLDDGSLLAWQKFHGQLAVPDCFQNHGVSSFCMHAGRLLGIPSGGGRAYSWGGSSFFPDAVSADEGSLFMPYQHPIVALIDANRGMVFLDERRRPITDVLFLNQVPEFKQVLDHVRVENPKRLSVNLSASRPGEAKLLWLRTDADALVPPLKAPIPIGNLRSEAQRPAGRLRVFGSALRHGVNGPMKQPDGASDYIACSARSFGWDAIRSNGDLVTGHSSGLEPPWPVLNIRPEGLIGRPSVVDSDGCLVHWDDVSLSLFGEMNGIDLMDMGPGFAGVRFRDGTAKQWEFESKDVRSSRSVPSEWVQGLVKVSAGNRGVSWLRDDGTVIYSHADGGGPVLSAEDKIIDIDDVFGGFIGLTDDGRIVSWGERVPFGLPSDLPAATAIRGGGQAVGYRAADGTWDAWVQPGYEAVAAEILKKIQTLQDPIDVDLFVAPNAARLVWIEPSEDEAVGDRE